MSFRKYIDKWITPHRRGIMGTVIFHLLLAIFLLSMEISRMSVHAEMEIVMDVPGPEEIHEKKEEEQQKELIRQKSSEEEVQRMLRSLAVNENSQAKPASADVQKYVDEILRELEEDGEAGRYKARRDEHYKHDSLQSLRDKKEQELDSLKSTFYSGESSVSYNLPGRYARFLPIPVYKCEYGGRVVVEITVNRKGTVQKAVVLESESQDDDCIRSVAVDAAQRSRFNTKPDAPALQKGTITFNFVRQ